MIHFLLGNFNESQPALPRYPPDVRPDFWIPPLNITWQWPIPGYDLDASNIFGQAVVIDLFATKQESMNNIRAAGVRAICSFSAGTWQRYAPDSGNIILMGISYKMFSEPHFTFCFFFYFYSVSC